MTESRDIAHQERDQADIWARQAKLHAEQAVAFEAELAAMRAENAELREDLVRSSEDMGRICAERQWRPIETAPKDGTEILLFGACSINGQRYARGAHVGWRGPDDSCWDTRDPEAECDATHWQPLPEPPAALTRKPGDSA